MQTQAALKIQSWFRGCLARRNYILIQAAIATIRQCIQARRQRARYKIKGYSSLLLVNCHKESQHDYLSFLPRFLAVQHSVQVIQKRWRETLIARVQRVDFLRFRKSVIYFQALWRGQRVRDSLQKVTFLFVGKSGNKHITHSYIINVSVCLVTNKQSRLIYTDT